MASIETDALVLRYVDFGESDRIVHLLTPRHGKIAAIAKGARRSKKRFPGTLDLFNHLKVQFVMGRQGKLARLGSARLQTVFVKLRNNPSCFALGCYLIEILDRATPEGGSPQDMARVFSFALGAHRSIGQGECDRRLRVLLELRILDALGVRPQLKSCVRCGETDMLKTPSFHIGEGGIICDKCVREADSLLAVRPGTLRALGGALGLPLRQLRRLHLMGPMLEEADQLVRSFQRFHLGVSLRSQRFLDQII